MNDREWTRRSVLQLAAVPFVLGTGLAGETLAQNTAPAGRLIDMHHHAHPPELLKWWGSGRAEWTTERSLTAMDQYGVAIAMLSITQPGIWKAVDPAGSVKLARICNEYMADAARKHPGRFGVLPTLPLPEIDASLKEIAYGFDVLKGDGICLVSSYGLQYLGDAAFTPVMEELNRRKAVVYVHPMTPQCCLDLVPGMPGAAGGGFEVPVDTTRTIESLLYNGVFSRLTDITWIFAHGGGVLPFIANRMTGAARNTPEGRARVPEGPAAALSKLYLDTASVAHPSAWAALTTFTTSSRIMFGTDFPYGSLEENRNGLREMEQRFGASAADIAAIEHGNVERIFPGLRA